LGIREAQNEYTALSRLLSLSSQVNFLAVGIMVNRRLAGFSINELLNREYALLHFEKASSPDFVGIYPYIMQETACLLLKENCQFLNYEQDLGIPGLKKAKSSYQPCNMLKKYIIQRAN